MSEEPLRVLYVTSEVYPLAKTGGLGDVSSILPSTLRQLGVDARLLMPGYSGVIGRIEGCPVTGSFPVLSGLEPVQLFRGILPEAAPGALTPVYVIYCPALYERSGGPYVDENGHDWFDNALRFAVLSKVAALFGSGAGLDSWRPHIVHCNDWQTGLAPVYLAYDSQARARSVISIHNLAFQGNFSPDLMPALGLPWSCFHHHGVEFYGHISYLKGGLYYSDRILTVSRSYAIEIQTPEFGFGLEGLLVDCRDRFGILNGIDVSRWNPGTDLYLPAHYDVDDLYGKAENKRILQARMMLDFEPDLPVLALVTRLTYQKGVDLILGIVEELLEQPLQFVVLGSGDKNYEAQWRALAENYPGRVGVAVGYDEELAHLIEAGADLFLMPSRFEPCGLNQMYSMRYGTLPVVRRTGGLADSVVDTTPRSLLDGTATGFVFENANRSELLACLLRALLLYSDRSAWRRVQYQAMRCDFSWASSAAHYLELYLATDPFRRILL